MKKLSTLILCFSFLIAYAGIPSGGLKTYVLELRTLSTEYGNILGVTVPETLYEGMTLDWKKVPDEGDFTVKIKFIEGLDPKQYARKKDKDGSYYFQVAYRTPQYTAEVLDEKGNLLFDRIYGREILEMDFGKGEGYEDPSRLAAEWKKVKDGIYKAEELKYNNIDEFFPILIQILTGEMTAEMLAEKTTEEDKVAPSNDLEKDDVTATKVTPTVEKEEPVNTIVDSNEEPTKTIKDEPVEEDKVGEEEKAVISSVVVETPEERQKRLEEESRKFEEMEQEEIRLKKERDGRVRRVRVGFRLLVPNIAGGHAEIVLPIANNRISLVGDYSRLSALSVFDRFLDDDLSIGTDGGAYFQYYSAGLNYYFRKKYARGWYMGASYLKSNLKTSASDIDGNVEIDAAALRFGLSAGRKAFMFGFEVGAGLPFNNLKGEVITVDEVGIEEVDVIDEKVNVIPILNVTLSVAL